MLEIDGSLHSGSGIIVRQAVVYAALTGRPLRIRNARARRSRPGLRPQHLRAIEAVRDLVGGILEGAEVGSQSFVFRPGDLAPAGPYTWDIGTAGSATMLALAVLPLLAVRGRGVEAEIRGGLFQDFAPSFFHLKHVLLPMLAQTGVTAEIDMVRPGYVPAGEGVIRLSVPPAVHALRPLVPRRGQAPARIWGIALSSHLGDRHVSARMADAARSVLGAAGISAGIEERSDATAAQPGAAFALFAEFIGGARLGADRAGAPHRPAERIGARVAHQLLAEIAGGATIDRHASDQILPFASLASGASKFQVLSISEHTETGGWLASLFLGADVRAEATTIVIHGRGTRRLPRDR
ncbi:MAG TPA: RNA 3'-terminal phosphate cyclase [Streptosporangiaceae bacterium]|nr:RNA 3'-terminal phosphate cyclase [Streptosporangiaceae bacterium]